VWEPGHKGSEVAGDGTVTIAGITIDFLTGSEVGQTGGGIYGIEAISDPDAVVWSKVGDVHYAVAPVHLPWLTSASSGGVLQPIVHFDLCAP
jgi:hypothetical protein